MVLMYAVGVCVCLCSRLVVFVICSVNVKDVNWSSTVVLLCVVGVSCHHGVPVDSRAASKATFRLPTKVAQI